MSSRKSLVTTTDKIVKEGNTDMGKIPNVVTEANTPPIAKNNIDTIKNIEKSQAYQKRKSSSNKSDKGKSLDKSRSTQRTETEGTVKTVNKSRYISYASLSEKVPK